MIMLVSVTHCPAAAFATQLYALSSLQPDDCSLYSIAGVILDIPIGNRTIHLTVFNLIPFNLEAGYREIRIRVRVSVWVMLGLELGLGSGFG